jgi:nicotinamidase-related amidase
VGDRPRLAPADGEALVHERFGDSFEATDLEERLAEHGVGRLVVTGAQTDACIRSTLHGALVRGYDATPVSDGHTTEDMRRFGMSIGPEEAIAHTNTYWAYTAAPGRTGTVTSAAEVDCTTP